MDLVNEILWACRMYNEVRLRIKFSNMFVQGSHTFATFPPTRNVRGVVTRTYGSDDHYQICSNNYALCMPLGIVWPLVVITVPGKYYTNFSLYNPYR